MRVASWKLFLMRLKLSRIGSGVLTVAFMCAAAAATDPAASRFDPARVRPGRFTYRLLEDGKPTGSATITIRSNADGTFAFANVVSGSFAQRWSATTDASFAPISVELTFQQDAVPTMQVDKPNWLSSQAALDKRTIIPLVPVQRVYASYGSARGPLPGEVADGRLWTKLCIGSPHQSAVGRLRNTKRQISQFVQSRLPSMGSLPLLLPFIHALG
jgi:hypothetical protein